MYDKITPLILTYNESPNIGRCLQQLTWAKRIVVIDSFSSDDTLEICKSFPQVDVYQRKFDTAANQDNYGLDQVSSEWVLSLDADYILTNELVEEIGRLSPDEKIYSYWGQFRYSVFGKILRGTLYPPRKVLYRREKARYEDDGHTQRVRVEGGSSELSAYILHDDRKQLSRWLSSQDRYMIQESQKFLRTPRKELGKVDLMRSTKIFAPFILFFYCLIVHRGILDGWAGLYYAFQRMLAEILFAIRLIEDERLRPPIRQIEIHPISTLSQQRNNAD